MGCYRNPHYENANGNELGVNEANLPHNSIENCGAFCLSNGYYGKYFSVENSRWCRCLDQVPTPDGKIDDQECQVQDCSGDSSQKCGDHWKGAIYRLLEKGRFKPPDGVSFCGTLAHFHMPTSDISKSFLEADFNVCEKPPYPPNNQALNICMKELTYCKKRGKTVMSQNSTMSFTRPLLFLLFKKIIHLQMIK